MGRRGRRWRTRRTTRWRRRKERTGSKLTRRRRKRILMRKCQGEKAKLQSEYFSTMASTTPDDGTFIGTTVQRTMTHWGWFSLKPTIRPAAGGQDGPGGGWLWQCIASLFMMMIQNHEFGIWIFLIVLFCLVWRRANCAAGEAAVEANQTWKGRQNNSPINQQLNNNPTNQQQNNNPNFKRENIKSSWG